MNTTILEAYAAEPSRQTLKKVSDRFKKHGAKFDLRVMATHGGTISWKAKELARTIVSGPIGGVIGSKLLGEALGDENIACSDIGGTSFDVALITKGSFAIKSDPDMARLVLSLPLVAMDSVGAGAGSFVRLDPTAAPSSWGRTAPATASAPAGRKAGWTRCRCPTATWCWATSTPTTSWAAPSSWTWSAPASTSRRRSPTRWACRWRTPRPA
jgi:N-methylhydantoinase A/oxoprolinase/acetone carboxylase beta subunit